LPNAVDASNITVYVLWALVGLVVAMGGSLAWVIKYRTNGRVNGHKTFADQPDIYWERMRQVVTEPLARSIDKQTDVMQELIRATIRIDERSKLRLERIDRMNR
jgi:hypothetical protein